jgi:hypothetical protein
MGVDLTDEQRAAIEQLNAPTPAPTPAESAPAMAAAQDAVAGALRKWERWEQDNFGKAKPFDATRAGVEIPARMAYRVRVDLRNIKSADEIPAVFERAAQDVPALVLARVLGGME